MMMCLLTNKQLKCPFSWSIVLNFLIPVNSSCGLSSPHLDQLFCFNCMEACVHLPGALCHLWLMGKGDWESGDSVCVCACLYVYLSLSLSLSFFVCVRVHVCMCISFSLSFFVCVCVCTCLDVHLSLSLSFSLSLSLCVCVCVCMSLCMFVCM